MKFEEVKHKHKAFPLDETILPTRASKRSAGYDFRTKQLVVLRPNNIKLIYTDVKCHLEDDEVLMIYPRSGHAIKHGVVLANGTGVIDADYYQNEDNDGNIIIALKYIPNVAKPGKNAGVLFQPGERIAQGVVVKYQTEGEEVEETRKGGLGSTGK